MTFLQAGKLTPSSFSLNTPSPANETETGHIQHTMFPLW